MKELKLLELPHKSEEFKQAWEDWTEDRKDRKKPVTYQAAKRQLKILGSVPEKEAIRMIDHAINKGWTGIFLLKDQDNKPSLYL